MTSIRYGLKEAARKLGADYGIEAADFFDLKNTILREKINIEREEGSIRFYIPDEELPKLAAALKRDYTQEHVILEVQKPTETSAKSASIHSLLASGKSKEEILKGDPTIKPTDIGNHIRYRFEHGDSREVILADYKGLRPKEIDAYHAHGTMRKKATEPAKIDTKKKFSPQDVNRIVQLIDRDTPRDNVLSQFPMTMGEYRGYCSLASRKRSQSDERASTQEGEKDLIPPSKSIRYKRAELVNLGKSVPSRKTPEQWDELVVEAQKTSEHVLPTSSFIIEVFGDWERFSRTSWPRRKGKVDEDYNKIKSRVLQGLDTEEIAKRTGYSIEEVSEFLHENGLLTPEFIQESLDSVGKITTQQINDIKIYNGKQKEAAREKMLEAAVDNLRNPAKLRYLGLPGVNFIDYSMLFDYTGIDSENSLVAEKDRKAANVILSIVNNRKHIKGGERFDGLKVYEGPIHEALASKKYRGMKFNLVNLDFNGGWGTDKDATLQNLFKYGHVDDEAVIFITLNTTPLERHRMFTGRGNREGLPSDNPYVMAKSCLSRIAEESGFGVEELFEFHYRDTQDMETIGLKVRKLRHVVIKEGKMTKKR